MATNTGSKLVVVRSLGSWHVFLRGGGVDGTRIVLAVDLRTVVTSKYPIGREP